MTRIESKYYSDVASIAKSLERIANTLEGRKQEGKELSEDVDREADWLINQYNRNRAPEDHINDVDEIDQNNQPFGD